MNAQDSFKRSRSYVEAVEKAKVLARQGPRVAAVLYDRKEKVYVAVPGYICATDNDPATMKKFRQAALVDPDGVVYRPR